MWRSCELRNRNRCRTWWRRRTSSPPKARALSFGNSVGRARKGDRRKVFGHKRARPPTSLTWLGEVVSIPIRANKFWRRVEEWVMRKEAKNSLIAFEKSFHEREEPWVQVRRRHGREPHLPIELPVIRRYDAWRAVHVAGFSLDRKSVV